MSSTERESITAHPLSWPLGWPRCPSPGRARFSAKSTREQRYSDGTVSRWNYNTERSVYSAQQALLAELERLGAQRVVVSSNQVLNRDGTIRTTAKAPRDVGTAVYFDLLDDAGVWQPRVLACDRWDRLADNLWAIKLHVEALRGIDRWGVGSVAQAFSGYAALPERAGGRSWGEVLGLVVGRAYDREAIEQAYRRKAREAHPDAGGSTEAWLELQQAREQALGAIP